MEGRTYALIDQLQTNTTPDEVTLAGLDLGSSRTSILAKNVKINQSLKSLDAANKNISDKDGVNLALMLNTNKTLRKLELSRN